MLKRRGQSLLEYAVLIVIILGVLVAMQNYIKRGMQGRWKTSVDDFGDQYDPRYANSLMRHTVETNSDTYISTVPDLGGYYTNRVDISNSIETKRGYINVGATGQGL